MKKSTSFLLLTFLLLVAQQQAVEPKEKENTKIIFYIERTVQQEEDFVELSLTVKDQQSSLSKAMSDARLQIEQIKKMSKEYCESEGGAECGDDIIEVGNYQIDFKYQTVRKQPIFVGFIVMHDVKITIKNTENIGLLVDKILALGVHKINKVEWQPFEEIDAEQKAIDEGITQGTDLCGHISKKMGDILEIEQIFNEKDDKEDEEEDNGEDEEDEEEAPAILKFTVECIEKDPQPKAKPKKVKKKE